jgi:hypothetical protein
MAAAVGPLIGGLVTVGQQIGNAVNDSNADKDYRSGWTQQQLGVITAANPGKSVVIVYTDHDASGLVNSQMTILECQCPNSGTVLSYQCYVFDSGVFVLKGNGSACIHHEQGDFANQK